MAQRTMEDGMRAGILAAVIACGMIAAGCGKTGPQKHPAPLKNEPDGFGGLAWGTEVGKLPAGMAEDRMSDFMHQTAGMRLYRKLKEDADLGGAALSKVQYGFYKGRFYLVMVEFRGAGNFDRINRALSEKHGAGAEEQRAGAVSWMGEKVDLLLMKNGRLMYVYKPIDAEKLKDDKDKIARVRK
ncbi:MAG: hypothetical protein WCP22_12860 [Chlamydiota bacterium]